VKRFDELNGCINTLKEKTLKEIKELEERKKFLQAEVSALEQLKTQWRSPITLNVGGKKFTVTLNILTQQKDSKLAVMFSGRHELVKDDKGNVFLDRNSSVFKHVLAFLRDSSSWQLPQTVPQASLRKEFLFFGLSCPQLNLTVPFLDLQSQKQTDTLTPTPTTTYYPTSGTDVLGRGYELVVTKTFHLYVARVLLQNKTSVAKFILCDSQGKVLVQQEDLQQRDGGWYDGEINYQLQAGSTYFFYFYRPKGDVAVAYVANNVVTRKVGEFMNITSKSTASVQEPFTPVGNTYSVSLLFNPE